MKTRDGQKDAATRWPPVHLVREKKEEREKKGEREERRERKEREKNGERKRRKEEWKKEKHRYARYLYNNHIVTCAHIHTKAG